jgi:hypothetical protein
MYNAIRGAFRAGAKRAGRFAGSMYGKQSAGAAVSARDLGLGLGAIGVRGAGVGFRSLSKMSNAGLTSVGGAFVGGTYGAFSDDTSMVGGALIGAGIGGAGYGAARLGKRGMTAYGAMRHAGFGRSEAASFAMNRMGKMTARFIGNTYSRAAAPIKSTLKGYTPRYSGS